MQRTLQEKGRTCANHSAQCSCMLKEEASSPTIAIESLLLSRVINLQENYDAIKC